MTAPSLRLNYVGGPTALLDFDGVRLLTDPTFDPAGSDLSDACLCASKDAGPRCVSQEEAIGAVDAVLLSHDHHFDNLDHAGRRFADAAPEVVTTAAGAGRIGGHAIVSEAWQSHDLQVANGRTLRITATPARHGPSDGDRRPGDGFALAFTDAPARVVYISGDSVWYDGLAEVGRRFDPDVVLLFAGAARVREVGPAHLTLTAAELVVAAQTFGAGRDRAAALRGLGALLESRADIERAFDTAHFADRLCWPTAEQPLELELSPS